MDKKNTKKTKEIFNCQTVARKQAAVGVAGPDTIYLDNLICKLQVLRVRQGRRKREREREGERGEHWPTPMG